MAVPIRGVIQVREVVAAGSVQGDATEIQSPVPMMLVHATAANGTKGILLPLAFPGKVVFVKNDDSANAILKVYPAETTAAINALTAGDPIAVAAKKAAMFVCDSVLQWYTIPLLPS